MNALAERFDDSSFAADTLTAEVFFFLHAKKMNTSESKHLQKYLALHESASKEKDLIEKTTRRKTLVFQAYNESKNFIPNNDVGPPGEGAGSKAYAFARFPPTYLFYSLLSMLLFFPVGLYAVIQSRKVCIQRVE